MHSREQFIQSTFPELNTFSENASINAPISPDQSQEKPHYYTLDTDTVVYSGPYGGNESVPSYFVNQPITARLVTGAKPRPSKRTRTTSLYVEFTSPEDGGEPPQRGYVVKVWGKEGFLKALKDPREREIDIFTSTS